LSSHRQIFRSSALIGSASIVTILVGIIKVKVLAVLLGPAGVGVMGLFQNVMATASTLCGCGLEGSGVRQIAAAQDDARTQALIRRALLLANVMLGSTGILLLWLMRDPLSEWVFHDDLHADKIGWLGLGVFLSLMASSQMALLQGLRRIDMVAKVNIFGAVAGAIVGVALVWGLRDAALHWFVIVAPAASLLFSAWYAARLPQVPLDRDWVAVQRQWRSMFSLGIPLMAAGVLSLGTQLVARSWVIRDLGLDVGGYFQAAWSITMTYMGFVLSAMATDYLPRLTAAIGERGNAVRLVNEQTEMALLLAAPVLLAMLTLAPWVIDWLFADSFAPATEILRWQVMGDVFKVIGWPMGFIVLAMGRGDLFIATQLNWNAVYLLCLWLGMEHFGLLIAGIGFLVAYVIQVGLVRLIAGNLIDFAWQSRNLYLFAALLIASISIMVLASYGLSLPLGAMLMILFGAYSVWRLHELLDLAAMLKRHLPRR
jgi:O-antigen/teichoic acid export membrane protein